MRPDHGRACEDRAPSTPQAVGVQRPWTAKAPRSTSPQLAPGDSFTYTPGCPLGTPSGFMRGHYRMEQEDGTLFQVLELPAVPISCERR